MPHPLRQARQVALLAMLAVLAGGFPAVGAEAREPAAAAYWISVSEDGVYRVSHEELAAAAPLGSVRSASLALANGGREVPIWVEDGGDGSFDPGDALEFVGVHPRGEVSFYSPHSRFNAYRLSFDADRALRMTAEAPAGQGLETAPLAASRHYESDALKVRFRQRPEDPEEESWFWHRLSFLEEAPFATPLELEGLASGTHPARLRLELRGWSQHRMPGASEVKQHRVEVLLNSTQVAAGEWNGQETHRIEADLGVGTLHQGVNELAVRVPRRVHEGQEDPIVDLSLINWIEVDYPHSGIVASPQTRLVAEGSGERKALLSAPGARELLVIDETGRRWSAAADGEGIELAAPVAGPRASLLIVRDGAFRRAAAVEVDRASAWKRADHRADYLMIAHPSLLAGTERLAAYHRGRGLEVAVVDVRDVYDEFNHGNVHPRAIRDFIAYAHSEWERPAPRFVLLVGDASWDVARQQHDDEDYADWSYQPREAEQEGFLKNESTPYGGGPADRALIPTGSFRSAEGHAASDNYFVALEEGDFHPVLAIGRLPIVDPKDLDAIVDKTIRYIEESGVGPWRRQILWISNEDKYIQERTDVMAEEQIAQGFSAERIYPKKSEKSNEGHQERLLDAFGSGRLLVYFHGHGGRYIWRTGPTDYRKNRDLFNLDHLDALRPSSRLPIILSMTCYSAPFDHPLADSIGEKFLRLPDRGAIAVFAASWRNAPSSTMSRTLIDELTKPQTIGEAVLHAKRETNRRDMIETYNLLGDPAVPVAAPQAELALAVEPDGTGGLQLEASLPEGNEEFTGHAIVDWLGTGGVTLASEELATEGGRLETRWTDPTGEAVGVSVYMWDEGRGLDGVGALSWGSSEATEGAEATAEIDRQEGTPDSSPR